MMMMEAFIDIGRGKKKWMILILQGMPGLILHKLELGCWLLYWMQPRPTGIHNSKKNWWWNHSCQNIQNNCMVGHMCCLILKGKNQEPIQSWMHCCWWTWEGERQSTCHVWYPRELQIKISNHHITQSKKYRYDIFIWSCGTSSIQTNKIISCF